ncbi:RagB/SusD family nutrient uptake outer membrane protein [Chitinophaga sp. Cy-1792]|uniref:RagB/SusD family nutrient uptake outer membrane protein n=1 Tax=Chitinophaga sp. Cy-1792 TaxID=2608339 RepID=UPI00141FBB2E|nr:RagB/SusD family nutrient uptake outer membrane protein [Chitinophaga sp. Cy-1792]NIG57574.1 RagB/SusD family nutrient uptake outer membrane protein [Chitinophaga sp. Cy-1792]
MRKKYLPYLLSVSIFAASCSHYLDVKPKGIIIASTINDYDALLNSIAAINSIGLVNPLNPTDDITDPTLNPTNLVAAKDNFYFWHPYINGAPEKPDIWVDYYNTIANMNVITEGVLDATNGTEKKKKEIYAEAQVGRVYCYYHLLTFFAPGYNKTTAGKSYGVPYVTSTDISVPTPARPLLDANMQQLISDLKSALPYLESVTANNTRASKSAAYGLLSRLYMYMQDYPNAMAYADSVIETNHYYLLNYNDYLGKKLPNTTTSPEEVYARFSYDISVRYSDNLLQQYDTVTDLRIRMFAKRAKTGDTRVLNFDTFMDYTPNRGITYAEMLLNKAECLARQGDYDAAMDIVNAMRANRFKPADFIALTAGNSEAAISQILSERRRELAMKLVRWGDMKRLDQEGRMPAVNRIGADGTTVMATLQPHSLQYTFQIPLQVQAFNKDMPLNQQ